MPLPIGRVDTYFTGDYNLIVHPGRAAGVQGGFLAVRPDLAVYKEYRHIVLEGDHQSGSVWGGGVRGVGDTMERSIYRARARITITLCEQEWK